MARVKTFVFSVWIFLFVVSAGHAQKLPDDLDAYVEQAMKTFDVPGIAIAVVKDGKVVLAKGYGVRSLAEKTVVDENTLFAIASNTKAFTAAALAVLVEEGKLKWEDPVFEKLQGFQMYDPYVSKEMRVKDLLCHRSGLGLGQGDLLFWPKSTFARKEIVHALRYLKPATSFRSTYAYNNLMFVAAGQIVEEVSGTTWEKFVSERIFKPLNMANTNTSTSLFTKRANWARPHSKVDGKLQEVPMALEYWDNAGPAGSINSSAADMAKWLILQLNHGAISGTQRRIFSEESSEAMWSQHTVIPVRADPTSDTPWLTPNFRGYGLGWFLNDYKGRKLVGHTGGALGYVSRVILVPKENLGVVILTNAESGSAFGSILYHILDGYFGGPTSDYAMAFKKDDDKKTKEAQEKMAKMSETRDAKSKPSLALENYAGAFSDPWYGEISVSKEANGLVLKMQHTPGGIADLQHWQYDTFKAHWRDRTIEDAFVTFALKADGSIDHFTMSAVSPLADFSFDYQDLYVTPVPKKLGAK